MTFKERVLEIVKKIPKGKFLSYKNVAKMAGKPRAYRAVANLMAKGKSAGLRTGIPCHRVIKNNYEVGGYKGSIRNSWKKAALLLREGAVGVIPTDTIYGICGSAFNKVAVEKIYKLRKRNPKKPAIVLIDNIGDLKKFGVKVTFLQKKFLSKVWPSKISAVLKCPLKKFSYLHRGTNTLAFRAPKDRLLRQVLRVSGPLIAPSANFEGEPPAKTIAEARKYFQNQVFYYDAGKIITEPSTLLDLTKNPLKVLRRGGDYAKIKHGAKRV